MSTLQYEDTNTPVSADICQNLRGDLLHVYRTKAALRHMIVDTFGDDVVVELDWSGETVEKAIGSLVTYCQSKRLFHKLQKNERLRISLSRLLGADIVRVKDESDDGLWVDGPNMPNADVLGMLAGNLIQHFVTEDVLRKFVEEKMKFLASQVVYGSGIGQAVRSLLKASTERKRLARLCEMAMNHHHDHELNGVLMFMVMQKIIVGRNGQNVSISC